MQDKSEYNVYGDEIKASYMFTWCVFVFSERDGGPSKICLTIPGDSLSFGSISSHLQPADGALDHHLGTGIWD